jgi:hypothetical protein
MKTQICLDTDENIVMPPEPMVLVVLWCTYGESTLKCWQKFLANPTRSQDPTFYRLVELFALAGFDLAWIQQHVIITNYIEVVRPTNKPDPTPDQIQDSHLPFRNRLQKLDFIVAISMVGQSSTLQPDVRNAMPANVDFAEINHPNFFNYRSDQSTDVLNAVAAIRRVCS